MYTHSSHCVVPSGNIFDKLNDSPIIGVGAIIAILLIFSSAFGGCDYSGSSHKSLTTARSIAPYRNYGNIAPYIKTPYMPKFNSSISRGTNYESIVPDHIKKYINQNDLKKENKTFEIVTDPKSQFEDKCLRTQEATIKHALQVIKEDKDNDNDGDKEQAQEQAVVATPADTIGPS